MEPEPILPSPQVTNETINTQENLSSGVDASQNSHGKEAAPIVAEKVNSPKVSQPPQSTSVTSTTDDDIPTSNPTNSQAQPQTDSPAIADDVDVIEKEWVDKAKQIVESTKDDPHKQEKEVSKLQADYLMKRYGKQIKTVE